MSESLMEQPGGPCVHHDLHWGKAISRWDEAVPLGNGLTGCLVWGDGNPLRFSLDRADLWDERVAPETLQGDFNYANLIELVKSGQFEAIIDKYEEPGNRRATPTKIAAGRLELDFGENADRVESHLSLKEAVATVDLLFGARRSTVKIFTHATNALGHISIRGTTLAPAIRAVPPAFGCTDGMAVESAELGPFDLRRLGYPSATTFQDGCVQGFYQRTCQGLEYAVVTAQRVVDGDGVDIVYVIASNVDGANWLEDAKEKVVRAVETGSEYAEDEHRQWWADYWSRSSVSIPDSVFERQWYLTNYLFGSCSRKDAPPMSLQGIWTADEGLLPPWKGEYANNTNTQMCYWHYLKSNHLSEGESLIDFLWRLVPAGRRYARKFFDADGLCMPCTMSLNGEIIRGWAMHTFNLADHVWLSQAFDQYWRCTGDDDFLRDKAYPYMKETAECVLRWLKPGADGKLRLPLSSSPEIHDNRPEAWLGSESNYDIACMTYLFRTLRTMAQCLNSVDASRWADIIAQLPELAVDKDNVLMLSENESLRESHRHLSHTMALFPFNLLDPESSPRDLDVVQATVAHLETLGKGLWIGFSFPWMAELYARIGNGEAAHHHLALFFDNFCSRNGFNLNGDFKHRGISWFHYRPFTLEANMAAADAIQEMLLQTHNGIIRVFPAIPEKWKEWSLSFRDFRAERGAVASARMTGGRLDYIIVRTDRAGVFRVQNRFSAGKLLVTVSDTSFEVPCLPMEVFDVSLKCGEICTIRQSG